MSKIFHISKKVNYLLTCRHNDVEVLRKINELDNKLKTMEKEKSLLDRTVDSGSDIGCRNSHSHIR